LPTDVGLQRALSRLGAVADEAAWRPWRSYAAMALWNSLDDAVEAA
jgi:AraC family transcriptional regulator of adaptative response / DNA-3-methyladenine glycosylase II